MLYRLVDSKDSWIKLIVDDPVRPEIPAEFRVSSSGDMFVLLDSSRVLAVVCVSYKSSVPQSIAQLMEQDSGPWAYAVFYTIWSYCSGSGREMLVQARQWIKQHKPNISTFVTLSPKTDLARKFHLSNGADQYRVNSDSVNFIYP